MDIFAEMEKRGHEQVIFNYDRATGLKAIIAIHDTSLGPALGGCRMWPYQSEDAAVEDALRLAEGMTWKVVASGLDYGGGQVVILADPATGKNEATMRALGRFIETLNGRFRAAEDVGTRAEDLALMRRETSYLMGLPSEYGGSGNTAEITAYGVIEAMRAALKHRFGSIDLEDRVVAVQGLGKIGLELSRKLKAEGATVIAADINPHAVGKAVAELGVEPADPWEILDTPCDIFAPCALGSVINHQTVDRLNCKIIAGSANNQLEDDGVAKRLTERGILYAPDFIANAGGILQVTDEFEGYREGRVRHRIKGIFDMLLQIFETAESEQRSTVEVALALVEERMRLVNHVRRIYTGQL